MPARCLIDEIFLYKVRNRMEQLMRFVKNSCVLENSRPVPSYIYPRQGTTIKQKAFYNGTSI